MIKDSRDIVKDHYTEAASALSEVGMMLQHLTAEDLVGSDAVPLSTAANEAVRRFHHAIAHLTVRKRIAKRLAENQDDLDLLAQMREEKT